MEKNRNEELAKLEKELKELPEKMQRAICWVIENFDFAAEMCREPNLTDEEIETYKEIAREKEDYIMLALLCMAEIYKKEKKEGPASTGK